MRVEIGGLAVIEMTGIVMEMQILRVSMASTRKIKQRSIRFRPQRIEEPRGSIYYSLAAGYNLSITFLAFLGRSTSTFDDAIYTACG